MPFNYSGLPSNVTQTASPEITLPVDGDGRSADSVNAPFKRLADFVALIWTGFFTGSGANPGITATGGATGPGVKAVPGGGSTPVRGAWSTPAQVTPSAPTDGDTWYDGTSWFACIVSTTKQFVTAVGGILTRAQLPAVAQQVSASSGGFNNAAAAFVDVTNLSVTITTSGRPVMLNIQPDGTATASHIGMAVGTHFGAVQLLRGATVIAVWDDSTASNDLPVSPVIDAPAAGTYTYKVQAKGDGVGQVIVQSKVLVAYEL